MDLKIVQRLDAEVSKKRAVLKVLKDSGAPPEEVERAYQELSTLETELAMAKAALAREIEGRVPEEKQLAVLLRRYVELETYKAIEIEMNISERYVYKLHRAGKKSYEAAVASEIV